MTCWKPHPGPMYWDWRCLNCGQPIANHPPLWRRILRRFQSTDSEDER